jgi:hypothetical protein
MSRVRKMHAAPPPGLGPTGTPYIRDYGGLAAVRDGD